MSFDNEMPSGTKIVKHSYKEDRQFNIPIEDQERYKLILDFVEKNIGKVDNILHELISEHVHVDILHVAPSEDLPVHTFITAGMSYKPTHIPEGYSEFKYTELILQLPAKWEITQESLKDENIYWPIRWLKKLAIMPHEFQTWLGYYHTIPNTEDALPFAPNTSFSCMMMFPPILLEEEKMNIPLESEESITLLQVVPIYKEEMTYKIKAGCEALFNTFNKKNLTLGDLLDPKRKNACKKGWFGF